MKKLSGLIKIERDLESKEIRLLISVAEIGHPRPLTIELGAHEWSQILAYPGTPQPVMVVVSTSPDLGKVG